MNIKDMLKKLGGGEGGTEGGVPDMNNLAGDLGIDEKQLEEYAAEAKEKWGNTDAFKQSEDKMKKMGKLGMLKVMRDTAKITSGLAAALQKGEDPKSENVQKLIAQHYNSLRAFYEPNLDMYRGLADMYVSDARFTETYDKIAPGMAKYMRDGMIYFVETGGEKK